jgi:hypothetical protein
MIYPKNVPNVERVLRVLAGIVLLGAAFYNQAMLSGASWAVTGLLIFSALFTIVTGFVGWCPACAMIGRKIKSKETH